MCHEAHACRVLGAHAADLASGAAPPCLLGEKDLLPEQVRHFFPGRIGKAWRRVSNEGRSPYCGVVKAGGFVAAAAGSLPPHAMQSKREAKLVDSLE
jgi:hypothetical protein